MTLPRAMKLFGTEEPVPETHLLRAGPLEATLDAGNLRHISLYGVEAIRAISYIVRDRNWGTYNPEISDLSVERSGGGFRVTYDAVCRDAQQSFAYRARIEADASGNLTFAADGEALSDFVTNRTGFVVLHPLAGVSGAQVEIERVDGSVETSRFPELIDPTCPFRDIRALTHEPLPGVRVACRMEGDTFEMEDQRNWMDASYKTYVRPLALPWPYTIAKDEKLGQQVSLAVAGVAAKPATASGSSSVTVSLDDRPIARMPSVGLAVPGDHARAALDLLEPLRALGPAHLVAEFDARKGHDAGLAQGYGELARALGADLVLEVVLPCVDANGNPTADPEVLRRDLDYVKGQIERVAVRPDRVAVSPAVDLGSTLPGSVWPVAPSWADLMSAARDAFPGLPVGGGMFSYFTELNRKRPPAEVLDFICHTTCPLVHAGDDLSLTEGLEALPYIFQTTRSFAASKPYWLFPTAIAMRQNPYGAAPAENPHGGRVAMARTDPREHALIGAAWYAGYLAHAARAGLDAVTLAAVAGPSGVVAPGGEIWPVFHVLRGHAALREAQVLGSRSSAPRDVQALAARNAYGGLQVWLANLTETPQRVHLDPGAAALGDATLALIDEESFDSLGHDARALAGRARPVRLDAIELPPYAVARLAA
jgi:D-apionolactonase